MATTTDKRDVQEFKIELDNSPAVKFDTPKMEPNLQGSTVFTDPGGVTRGVKNKERDQRDPVPAYPGYSFAIA